jgi:hypothetical protein
MVCLVVRVVEHVQLLAELLDKAHQDKVMLEERMLVLMLQVVVVVEVREPDSIHEVVMVV